MTTRSGFVWGFVLAGIVVSGCGGGGEGTDAGRMSTDSGGMNADAGMMDTDSGPASTDSGGMNADAGMMDTDSGTASTDSGTSDGGVGPTDAGMMPDAGPCGTDRYFASVCNLFLMRCAGCHTGGASMGGLAMGSTAASMHAALVGPDRRMMPGCRAPTELVTPGDPMASFLYLKVTGMQGPSCGVAMPLGTRGLSTGEAELVRAWIAAGATGP
jgi:hypothetical protein